MNKKAFSMVELLIAATIIILLAIVGVKISTDSATKTINTKVETSIAELSNGLNSYLQANGKLPLPDGNQNFYKKDGAYVHEKFDEEGSEAFGVYGKLTENVLGKTYLTEVPRDPKTNNYFSFGVSVENDFEVAGVVKKDGDYIAKVSGTYRGDYTDGLIREYNGARFIVDGSKNLPYNPEKIIFTVTDDFGNIFEGGKITYNKSENAINGKKLQKEITKYNLYFSDGNLVELDATSDFSLNLETLQERGAFSEIRMALEAGTMIVFASRHEEQDEEQYILNITANDYTAAVRGTIVVFSTTKNSYNYEGQNFNLKNGMLVIKGTVEVDGENISPSSEVIESTTNSNSIASGRPSLKEKTIFHLGNYDDPDGDRNYLCNIILTGKVKSCEIVEEEDENGKKIKKLKIEELDEGFKNDNDEYYIPIGFIENEKFYYLSSESEKTLDNNYKCGEVNVEKYVSIPDNLTKFYDLLDGKNGKNYIYDKDKNPVYNNDIIEGCFYLKLDLNPVEIEDLKFKVGKVKS